MRRMLGRLFSLLLFWRKSGPQVAVVRLAGVIAASASPGRRGLNLQSVEEPLKKAFERPGVQAVALVINSPGGSPVQSELIGKSIRRLSKKHDVPVLAFCEDVAASGGYWIAAAADEIYASSVSVIGSIGVVSAGFGFPELLEKIGVERRLYTSGKSKAMLDPFSAEKAEDVAYLKSLQSDIHNAFIAHVTHRRGTRLADDDEIFSGKFWTGDKALALGLIDGIGVMQEILEKRFGDKLKLVHITQKKPFLPLAIGADARAHAYGDAVVHKAVEYSAWQRFGL